MWTWLTQTAQGATWRTIARIGVKGSALFVLANLIFALLDPLPLIGQISLYNSVIRGRARLPYGENPAQSYNLSLASLEALFAAHEINGAAKAADEYRVVVIGDSSVWGVLLEPHETLSGYLNGLRLILPDGRRLRAFNLGYPVQSAAKDLLLLDYATRYQPDLIAWLITPESLALDMQMATQLVRENPERIRALIARHNLQSLRPDDPRFITPDFLGRTIVGRRRQLADWLRLQLYGILWQLSGVDQQYPRFYEPRMEDFPDDMPQTWHGSAPPTLRAEQLALEMLSAGAEIAESVGAVLLVINEPVFISVGRNSAVRYNFFYPRWALDEARARLREASDGATWAYRDFWNAIPASQFTDSAVHLTPQGSRQLAELVARAIIETEGETNVRLTEGETLQPCAFLKMC
ncbi:MAG: hypothetical protein SNJ58_05560 [Aggregatilineales bacterium]